MRQVILGFIFGLALFATQGYFYYIEVFWFFFLGGTIFSLVLGENKKTWLLFYSSIIILFLSIIVIMFFEDPPEWHLQKGLGFLIMSLALGIPLWLKQKTPVVKLLLIAGFIGLVFQHQYLLTTPLKIVTLIEEDNPFENLLHLEDSADFVIPEGPFIAFTYNKGCGGCIRIANKLKSLQSSNFPPLYTIKLVTKRDKEPRNIPNYVKNLGLPSANYLIADTTVQNRHSAALAPTTYFYNPNQGLQTLEGYEVHVLDQLYHQFQQNPSWFSRLVPESWYTSLAPYLALLTIVLLFFGQSISTTIKKRKQSPTP